MTNIIPFPEEPVWTCTYPSKDNQFEECGSQYFLVYANYIKCGECEQNHYYDNIFSHFK